MRVVITVYIVADEAPSTRRVERSVGITTKNGAWKLAQDVADYRNDIVSAARSCAESAIQQIIEMDWKEHGRG